MNKQKIIFIFCTVFLITGFLIYPNLNLKAESDSESDSGTILLPTIYVDSINIENTENYKIAGKIIFGNDESYYLTDLNYVISLYYGTEFGKLKSIDSYISNEKFSVPPGQKIQKDFIYPYPKNIQSGDYTLRVQVLTSNGSALGWKDQTVELKGENKFLQVISGSPSVIVDNFKYTVGEGTAIDEEKQKAIVYFKIQNPGDQITVIPNIKINERQINMSVIREYQESPISFAKGETKEIKLELPKLGKAGSYLAEIKFLNENDQVSTPLYFRWVVRGISGKILNVKTEKDYFKAGENIDLIIETIGSADLASRSDGNLDVIIYDDNKIIGKVSEKIILGSNIVSSKISIPIKKDLITPKIEVKLINKDGQILDESIIDLPLFSDEAAKIARNRILYPIYFLIAIIIIAVIITVTFLIYKYKYKFHK